MAWDVKLQQFWNDRREAFGIEIRPEAETTIEETVAKLIAELRVIIGKEVTGKNSKVKLLQLRLEVERPKVSY